MRIPVFVLLALAAGANCAAAQRSIEERAPTAASGRVEISNLSGSVRVSGWERDEIRVTGTLGRGAERLEISPRGDLTEIRVVLPRNGRNIQGSDLEVRLPVGKDVSVRTTSADIEVKEVNGSVEAYTTSGDVGISGRPRRVVASSTSGSVEVEASATSQIQARSTSGDVRVGGTVRESVDVESTSGDVEVLAATPEVRAKSVSGDVRLRGATSRVSISTVSGDMQITGSRIQFGSFETVSGQLRFEGEIQRSGALNLQSHSGDIELLLPGNVSAAFEVNSFSGAIENAFGPAAQRTSRYGPGRELRFTEGQGEALVTARTFSGSVRLRKR